MQSKAFVAPLAAVLSCMLGSTALAATTLPAASNAAQLNAGLQAMRDYNLIVLGNLQSSSEVEGRTYVGGNLSGNASNYDIKKVAPNQPGLVVGGDTTGGKKNLNGGNGALVGGKVDSGVEFNNSPQTLVYGTSYSNTNVNSNTVTKDPTLAATLAAQTQSYASDFDALSTYLAGLTTTDAFIPPSNANNNKVLFDPSSSGSVAVYSLSSLTSSTVPFVNHDIAFDATGYDLIVINVAGTSVSLPGSTHFSNTSGLGTKVIWNFYQATSVTLSDHFDGSILAPHAAGTISNYIEGTAVFASLTQNGEVHMNNFSTPVTVGTPPTPPGAVPEPAAWALMIGGFGLAGAALRRRRAAAAA